MEKTELTLLDLGLTVRAYWCLNFYFGKGWEATTLDIISLTTEELRNVRNLGRRATQEVIDIIHSLGLKFKNEE